MNAASKRTLRSLVPVICPPEAAHLAEAIVDHMELTLDASGPLVGKAFEAGLVAYDLGAVARFGRRAHALTGDKAERYYQYWEDSQFGRAINQIMSLSCYEQPEMMEACGYRPAGWIEQVTKKRLTVFADDVRKQDAQVLAPDPLRPTSAHNKKEVA